MLFDIFRALFKLKDRNGVFAFLSFFSCFQAGLYIWKHSDVKPFLKQFQTQVINVVTGRTAVPEGGKFLPWNHETGWADQAGEVLNFSETVVSGFIRKKPPEWGINSAFFCVIQTAF